MQNVSSGAVVRLPRSPNDSKRPILHGSRLQLAFQAASSLSRAVTAKTADLAHPPRDATSAVQTGHFSRNFLHLVAFAR